MRKSVRHCHVAMRSGMLYLMLSVFCFIAKAQDNTSPLQSSVTVTGQNMSLLQIFQAIKKQTGFTLVYSNQLLNDGEKLNINFSKVPLQEVLSYLFKDRNINYEVKNNRIVLDRKQPGSANTTAAVTEGKQESRIVKGQVMDVQGHPLPGATVSIKGTTKGVITDELGVFAIAASNDDIIRVAMIGMNPEEVKVRDQKIMKVALTEKVDKLNEVVVVGFGSQKKVTVTGSVSTVNMEDMRTPVRSLTNSLVGKVAGVISMQSGGGEPGYDNPNFTIRGIGTFTGGTSPLIIVDGVQRNDVNSTYGGAFNNIDPEDVQSITLLKDASATAVYGAKGANGVLIITTKRGVAGKPKISAKVESGVNGLTRLPKMLNGVDYMKLYNEARINDGNTATYSDETIAKTASGLDPYLYPDVNWINTIYKEYTPMTNANMNVSGGGEAMRYYVSMSFYNQDGQYKVKDQNNYNPNLNFKRYDFRTNVDLNVTKTTVLSLNIAAMLVNSRYPGTSAGGIWYAAYATNPISFPVKYPGNLWAGPRNNGGSNPFNLVQNSGYSTEFKPSVQSVLSLSQKLDMITPGLTALGRFSFDTYGEFNTNRTGQNDLWYAGSRDPQGNLVYERVRNGSTYLGFGTSSSGERVMYLEGNIAYDRTFGNHAVGGLIVGTMRNRVIGSAENLKRGIPFRNQSMAARVTYGFKERYLAELNIGATGSENFESGKRWGYFPAVSAGWVISKEAFFEPLTHSINLLKIRGSIGTTGNDLIGTDTDDRFGYLTYIENANGISFGSSPNAYTGIAATVIGTENLTWEKSVKTDIGLEIGLWNKLSLTVDAFKDKRTAILINRQSISSIAGYSGQEIYANMGEMNNMGIDGTVEYDTHIGKDITLRLFGNLTYAKNKILFADNPKYIYAYQQPEGHRFGEYMGYVSKGLFVDQNDVDKSPTQIRTVFPGDIKYEDINGDGVVNNNDRTYLGKSSFPTWSYGYGFNLGYKKFSLSAVFAGVMDVGIMSNGSEIYGPAGTANGVGVVPFTGNGQYPANVLANSLSRWTAENPNQKVDYPRLTITNSSDNNYVNSSWWLKDGSFMRLKQASLGYALITPDMKKKGISNLEFYAAGTNLLTFSKFKLWDPELGSNGAKYPYAKTMTVGIRAQF